MQQLQLQLQTRPVLLTTAVEMMPVVKQRSKNNRARIDISKRRAVAAVKSVALVLLLWSGWQLLRFRNRMLKYIASNLQASSPYATEEICDESIDLSNSKALSNNPDKLQKDSYAAQPTFNSSLVIIIGNLRGGEEAWNSLYKNVLDVNAADLALLLGPRNSTSNYLYPNSSLYTRAKFIWNFHEYTDWTDAIDLINGTSWRETHLPYFVRKRTGLLGGVKGHIGSGAIIFMLRWFLSQHLLENPDVLNQYERFAITRSDHYYQCRHQYKDLDLSNNTVWVPQGEDYGGVTDRHLIVSRANILDTLDIFPSLLRQKDDQLQDWIAAGTPESILGRVWSSKSLNVKRMKRVMFTCATQRDSSRWKRAKGEVPGVPGLLKKNESEYNQTQQNCPAL